MTTDSDGFFVPIVVVDAGVYALTAEGCPRIGEINDSAGEQR